MHVLGPYSLHGSFMIWQESVGSPAGCCTAQRAGGLPRWHSGLSGLQRALLQVCCCLRWSTRPACAQAPTGEVAMLQMQRWPVIKPHAATALAGLICNGTSADSTAQHWQARSAVAQRADSTAQHLRSNLQLSTSRLSCAQGSQLCHG